MKKITLPLITPVCIAVFLCIDFSLYTVIVILSALLHECGHIAFMRAFGVAIKRVILLPVGAKTEKEGCMLSYTSEILISLGGCLVNLLLFLSFYSLYLPIAIANLFFFSLNILPIEGLDGGAILYYCFCLCTKEQNAAKISRAVSFVFSVILWALGGYIILCLNGNISLFALSLFLIITQVKKTE